MTQGGVIERAARLVLGGAEGSGGPGGVADPARVLALLRRNKVPLRALLRREGGFASWAAQPEVSRMIDEEEESHGRLLDAWRRVAAAFEKEGIRSVLFKSPGWFPSLSSNLDVLVAPARFQDAAAILAGLGHIRLPHYVEDHKLLFRTFEGGRAALSVHLHEAVSWGKVRILGAEGLIERALPGEEEGFSVSSPLDSLVVTVAHTVFETDQVRLGDLLIVARALTAGATPGGLLDRAERGSWPAAAAAGLRLFDEVARRAGGRDLLDRQGREIVDRTLAASGWAMRRVESILSKPLADLPLVLPRRFSKEILLRHLVGRPGKDPGERVADVAATAWNLLATRLRIRQRPAGLVTLSGPDGAGKSRLGDAVADALELCEVPVSRAWSRGGFSAPAVAGKALLRRWVPRAIPAPADEEAKRAFARSRWRGRLWMWTLVLEQAIAMQRVRLRRLSGRTVVGDRWVTDTLADLVARLPAEEGAAKVRRPASLLLAAAPAPDVALLIEVPAEVAHARKSDGGSLESRRRLTEAYGVAAAAAPVARLDGTLSPDELAQKAVEITLRACFARFARTAP